MIDKRHINSSNVNRFKRTATAAKQTSKAAKGVESAGIDKTDATILKHLLADSRLSYRNVASMIGVSVGTVATRVKGMEEAGVIKGYTTNLDHERLGYELTAITQIIVSKGKLIEMEKEVAKLPNVCAVYDVTGESDAIVIAKFKTRKELSAFTKGMLSMPFIEHTNTHVVLTTVKEDFRLVP